MYLPESSVLVVLLLHTDGDPRKLRERDSPHEVATSAEEARDARQRRGGLHVLGEGTIPGFGSSPLAW